MGHTGQHQGCLLGLRGGWPSPALQKADGSCPARPPRQRPRRQNAKPERVTLESQANESAVRLCGHAQGCHYSFSPHPRFSKVNAGAPVPTLYVGSTQPVWVHCCQVTSVMSDSVRPHRRQPTRLPRPWDSPGKNTGVGCHFLLQCMKVKSKSEVAQSCPTLRDPMDCSLPGRFIHGIFQTRVLEWCATAFSTEFTCGEEFCSRWIIPPISPTCYLEDIYQTEHKVHSGFSIPSNNSNKLCD